MSLHEMVTDPIVARGLVQLVAGTALALVVLALTRVRELALESEMGLALVRGLVQVLAMGAVLGVLLTIDLAWSWLVIAGMVAAAAWISKDRSQGMPEAFRMSLVAIAVGSGVVIGVGVATGAIESTVRNLVPVSSIVIVAAMRTQSLALDRVAGEITSRRDGIEQLLALGASPRQAIARPVRESVRASLIPVLDSLKSLGLVWIPGFMSGMILSGANPIYAAEYQFTIMTMVFAAAGLTTLGTSLLVGRTLFTDAEQLKTLDAAE